MNNPFDYTPDLTCEAAFRELCARIEELKPDLESADVSMWRELEDGKMLGVMIAIDDKGGSHTLYAFSGQLGHQGFHHPLFVEPVFDYLQPDGFFRTHEREISAQNVAIKRFESETLARVTEEFWCTRQQLEDELQAYREFCRKSKQERDERRNAGNVDALEWAAMVRQSQFEKAELHRRKKRVAELLEPLANKLTEAQSALEAMKEKRRTDSENLQSWLFDNFQLLNARGETRSLSEIFADTPLKVPPSGAGECCAPKLLQAAYRRGWHPVAMAEYWYGKPKGGEVRMHGEFYPACRGKCLPVLGWMLRGLTIVPPLNNESYSTVHAQPEVIYENEWFCVVNKPAGMLSVPGKGSAISVQQWLMKKYGTSVKMAHRLDQDTSGLIIATFDPQAFKIMQQLFAIREVSKTYIADLQGDYKVAGIKHAGQITLPLSPDWLDRPRQFVDTDNGKPAVTDYEFENVINGRSRVIFHPHTGRTHQLRVHAASQSGLGLPIVGDRLYGKNGDSTQERLHLHASRIEFTFPLDGRHYCFEIPVPF